MRASAGERPEGGTDTNLVGSRAAAYGNKYLRICPLYSSTL